jgi:hypothetical protein
MEVTSGKYANKRIKRIRGSRTTCCSGSRRIQWTGNRGRRVVLATNSTGIRVRKAHHRAIFELILETYFMYQSIRGPSRGAYELIPYCCISIINRLIARVKSLRS